MIFRSTTCPENQDDAVHAVDRICNPITWAASGSGMIVRSTTCVNEQDGCYTAGWPAPTTSIAREVQSGRPAEVRFLGRRRVIPAYQLTRWQVRIPARRSPHLRTQAGGSLADCFQDRPDSPLERITHVEVVSDHALPPRLGQDVLVFFRQLLVDSLLECFECLLGHSPTLACASRCVVRMCDGCHPSHEEFASAFKICALPLARASYHNFSPAGSV